MYKHADDKLYTLNLEKKMLNSFEKKNPHDNGKQE